MIRRFPALLSARLLALRPPLICALVVCVGMTMLTPSAAAQWKWRDAQGRMVYSDTPPPPSIPARRIVEGPGVRAAGLLEVQSEAAAKAAPSAATSAAAASTVNSGQQGAATGTHAPLTEEQAFQKRHEERLKADAAARQRDAEKQLQDARCARLRGYVSALESGLRASRTKPDGSVEFLDDAARKQELDQARSTAARECA